MTIKQISKERGINAIYDGNRYLIHSDYYGFVAKSTDIIRDNENNTVHIIIDMCDWSGYWSLSDIIKRGIRKLENQWIYKKVTFDIVRRNDGRMRLDEYFKIIEEDRSQC